MKINLIQYVPLREGGTVPDPNWSAHIHVDMVDDAELDALAEIKGWLKDRDVDLRRQYGDSLRYHMYVAMFSENVAFEMRMRWHVELTGTRAWM